VAPRRERQKKRKKEKKEKRNLRVVEAAAAPCDECVPGVVVQPASPRGCGRGASSPGRGSCGYPAVPIQARPAFRLGPGADEGPQDLPCSGRAAAHDP